MPEQKVPLSPRERLMLRMLNLAIAYVGRGVVEHAYDGCVVSGERALEQLEAFVKEVEAGGLVNGKRETPAPTVASHVPKDGGVSCCVTGSNCEDTGVECGNDLGCSHKPIAGGLCAVSDCGLSLQHGNYQSAVHAGPGREHA